MKNLYTFVIFALIISLFNISCSSKSHNTESLIIEDKTKHSSYSDEPSHILAEKSAKTHESPLAASPAMSRTKDSTSQPASGGLKAGFADDNAQFGYFVDFLAKYKDIEHHSYNITERITIKAVDKNNKPIANAKVSVSNSSGASSSGLTYSDGCYRFYPSAFDIAAKSYNVEVSYGNSTSKNTIKRDGPRLVTITLQTEKNIPKPLPLDILFVLDTTGSMGEEINRLKTTLEIIHDNISNIKPDTLIRFGLVLYKDEGDEYIVKTSPFTNNIQSFKAELNKVSASGGGDTPEDLESALDAAVNSMDWNKNGLKLAFVITDANAHLDYGRSYNYIEAAKTAVSKAIKLYTIGTGGLPLEGEYLLRQISQLTSAKYIFLTYGESGESEGGAAGSVSHHTGSNFQTEKLEAIIIRFVKEELLAISDGNIVIDDDYFNAASVPNETGEQTLIKLFTEAVNNVADYSSFHVSPETPCAIMPIECADKKLAPTAEYFTENLNLASAAAKRWRTVERKDMQKILTEIEFGLSGLADNDKAAKIGNMLGAELILSSTMYVKDNTYEIYVKLIRVSTAEVLAVTRAKIALNLGL